MGRVIEVKGGGFVNKGAELMILSVIKALGSSSSGYEIAIEWRYNYKMIILARKYGFRLKVKEVIRGVPIFSFLRLLPKFIRRKLNIVLDDEIFAVLDVSGFKYSDQFPEKCFVNGCNEIIDAKKRGKKIIMMPQAFGPFNESQFKEMAKCLIENVDLLFARDSKSFKYLQDIKASETIIQKPDFTSIIKPDELNETDNRVCIVPNIRMVEKTDSTLDEYVSFLIGAIVTVKKLGYKPYFLIHAGGEDKFIVGKVIERGQKIELVEESDPIKIKAIISKNKMLIGSRYHSLATALYLNVPVIGTGWSHKYKELFREFGNEDFLMESLNIDSLEDMISEIDKEYTLIVERLRMKNIIHNKSIDDMFDRVIHELENK